MLLKKLLVNTQKLFVWKFSNLTILFGTVHIETIESLETDLRKALISANYEAKSHTWRVLNDCKQDSDIQVFWLKKFKDNR